MAPERILEEVVTIANRYLYSELKAAGKGHLDYAIDGEIADKIDSLEIKAMLGFEPTIKVNLLFNNKPITVDEIKGQSRSAIAFCFFQTLSEINEKGIKCKVDFGKGVETTDSVLKINK